MDCIFCKIVNKDIETKLLYEDDECMVFHDIEPTAPVHILAIPKKHIEGVDTMSSEDEKLIGHIFTVLQKLAEDLDLKKGYRIITNIGEDGLQSIRHLHFHLLGGRKLGWDM
ncbi:MAG: histidine triad nucleotide-binding protein [Tissierellia bacterium]|nr:histidine triad nucleotide-binding protein [Tissierellia bacterium]